jgi:hypothetical protein
MKPRISSARTPAIALTAMPTIAPGESPVLLLFEERVGASDALDCSVVCELVARLAGADVLEATD